MFNNYEKKNININIMLNWTSHITSSNSLKVIFQQNYLEYKTLVHIPVMKKVKHSLLNPQVQIIWLSVEDYKSLQPHLTKIL